MHKLWIITILITFVLTGCGASPDGCTDSVSYSTDATANSETTTEATETTTKPAAKSTAKPTEATTTVAKKAVRQIQATDITTTREVITMFIPITKKIDINKIVENNWGTLIIETALVDYTNNSVTFDFKLSSSRSLEFDYGEYIRNFKCIDKTNKILSTGNTGGLLRWDDDHVKFIGERCSMSFYGFSTPSDISTVEVAYKFVDHDPVTVTFDIPGI